MPTAAISAKGASLRRGATVNTNGTAVTWVSGSQFTSALNGQSVTINGVAYSVTGWTATSLTLSASAGVQNGVPLTSNVLWGEVSEVLTINGANIKADTQDVTSHQSPGGWREFIVVLKDAGEITLEMNYVPTDNSQDFAAPGGLGLDETSAALRAFQLVFPDNATESLKTRWSFNGFVTAFNPSAPHDGALKSSVTIKVTGAPTLA